MFAVIRGQHQLGGVKYALSPQASLLRRPRPTWWMGLSPGSPIAAPGDAPWRCRALLAGRTPSNAGSGHRGLDHQGCALEEALSPSWRSSPTRPLEKPTWGPLRAAPLVGVHQLPFLEQDLNGFPRPTRQMGEEGAPPEHCRRGVAGGDGPRWRNGCASRLLRPSRLNSGMA